MGKIIEMDKIEDMLDIGDPKSVLSYIIKISGKPLEIETFHKQSTKEPEEFVYFSSIPGMKAVVEAPLHEGVVLKNPVSVAGYGTNYMTSLAHLCHALLTPKLTLGEHISENPETRQYLVVETSKGQEKIEIIGEPKRSWLNGPRIKELGLT